MDWIQRVGELPDLAPPSPGANSGVPVSGETQIPAEPDDAAERIAGASEPALERGRSRWEAIAPLVKDSPTYDPMATVAVQAEKHKVSAQAIYKWLAAYDAGGRVPSALMDRPRKDRGSSRTILDESLRAYAVETCLRLIRLSGSQTPPIAAVLERIKALAPERGWEVPSRYAVRRLLWAIPRAQRVFMARGEEGYLRDVAPKPEVHRADGPNETWVVDHQELHIRVWDGELEYRPHLTAVLDRFDGCLLGFCLSRQGNAMTVGLALRMAILEKQEDPEGLLCGLPRRLYHDRGKDMLSKHVEGALADLGIEAQPTLGRSPYSKGDMESFFSTLTRKFIRFLPGHTGDRPTRKPVKTAAVLTVEELRTHLRNWLFLHYNASQFHRRRLAGKRISRLEWRRSSPIIPRMPKRADLMLLLLKRAIRQVGIQGIRLAGMFTYWNDALLPLAEEKATVEVRYDPADMSRVYVFHRNRFICIAQDSRALAARATMGDSLQRLSDRAARKAAVKATLDPVLRAAEEGGDAYLEHLERQRQTSVQAAAGAGRRRPVIPVLLPREAQVSRGARRKPVERYDPFDQEAG